MRDYVQLLPFVLVGVLAVVAVFVWSAVLASDTHEKLLVAFLDVGQGDAIFIQTPNGVQVLVDGGKGGAVLSELGKLMAFRDRTIDVVIATHPDLDHIGGLPEVFARYAVHQFFEPGVVDDGADYQALVGAVQTEGLSPIHARRGQTIVLDEGVSLEILFPDRAVDALDANMGSVVARLTYGDTSVLLTGDSPATIEEYLVSGYGEALQSDILKLGHHGSKTSTTESFLGFVDPEYGIVSAECDNSYGHPHQEVVDRLTLFGVKQVSTCDWGTVVFESDGVEFLKR